MKCTVCTYIHVHVCVIQCRIQWLFVTAPMPTCWYMSETVVLVSHSIHIIHFNWCLCVVSLTEEVLQDVKDDDISEELVKKFDAEK